MPDTETLTEEQLKEIEAANEEHRIDWRYPNQKDRIRALCRSLRAAWKERDDALVRAAEDQDEHSAQRVEQERDDLRQQLEAKNYMSMFSNTNVGDD